MGIAETLEQDTGVNLFPEADRMPIFWANLTAQERIVINQGGMYSGKSHAIMRVLFFYACYYPDLVIDVVANSVPKLKEDTMHIAEGIVAKNYTIQDSLAVPFNKTDRVYHFKNGSRINFKSYENSELAEGAKRDILYINEARRIDWATAFLLIKRTNKKVFIDYNPVSAFWAHDELINCPEVNGKKQFPSVKVIRSWHIHNHFISDEKHEEIESIADPELWKAYARGLTAQISGIVYPNWVEIPTFPTDARSIIWGIDLGFTNDPTVILKIAMDYGGFDFIIEEYGYAPGIPAGDMGHIMFENGYKRGQPAYMDHNKAIKRQLRALGITAVHALKGGTSVEAGILHVRTKKVAYTSTSTNLKHEVRRHSFLLDKNGKTTNKPEHQHSHGPSAARYGIFTHDVRNGKVKGYSHSSDEEESSD